MLEIIPENPVKAFSETAVLPTIFFSIMIGIGILLTGEKAKPVNEFFDSAAEVVMKITSLIMEMAPFGVLALMSWVMAKQGLEVVINMGKLAFALYLACFLQIVLIYGFLIIKVVLKLPLRPFFRGVADAQGVAYSTASSAATLPVTISCAEKNLGVDKTVAGSVLPLGATINMDGTAIYLGLVALFAAQAAEISVDFGQYVMVALMATFVSIGAAGIPSAGLLLAATVLGVVGIDDEQALLVIAFIFPFDRLLDMMRTMTNITGDIAVACTVAKWEGNLNETIFVSHTEKITADQEKISADQVVPPVDSSAEEQAVDGSEPNDTNTEKDLTDTGPEAPNPEANSNMANEESSQDDSVSTDATQD